MITSGQVSKVLESIAKASPFERLVSVLNQMVTIPAERGLNSALKQSICVASSHWQGIQRAVFTATEVMEHASD
jgi:hypothetical protein